MSRLTLRDPAFLAATAPAVATVVTSGLQLYVDAGNTSSYPGTGTTWTDLSGNSRNCTLTGGPTYNSADGGSFYFNGSSTTNQYAQMSGTISSLTAATFFAFVKRDGDLTNYNGIIFSRGGGGSVTGMNCRDSGGTALGYHWNDSEAGFGNLQIPNTTWCMVAVTFGSATATGYLGTSSGITNQSTGQTLNSSNLNDVEIAGGQTFANRFFKGNISVAMIYNRALSSAEITQNFNVFKGRYSY